MSLPGPILTNACPTRPAPMTTPGVTTFVESATAVACSVAFVVNFLILFPGRALTQGGTARDTVEKFEA